MTTQELRLKKHNMWLVQQDTLQNEVSADTVFVNNEVDQKSSKELDLFV